MRKHFFLLLSIFVILSACQSQNERSDEIGGFQSSNGSEAANDSQTELTIPTLAVPAATISVENALGRPQGRLKVEPSRDVSWNAIVSLTGQDFPAGQTIFLQAQFEEDDSPFILGHSSAGAGGEFSTEVMVPAGHFGRTLEIFALTSDGQLAGETSLSFANRAHVFKIEDPESGFSLTVPDVWKASDRLKTPLGDMILLGPDPRISGDPGTSVLLIAAADALSEREAASLLTCGTVSCLAAPSFDSVELGGQPAKRLTIGTPDTPSLEWYFIKKNGRLIYFTLHDPVTLRSIPILIDSVEFSAGETAAVSPTATMVPTRLPTQTPRPPSTSTPVPTPTTTSAVTAPATTVSLPSPTLPPSTPDSQSPVAASAPPPDPDPSPTVEVAGAGPLQTVTDFILLIIRGQVDERTPDYLTASYRAAYPDQAALGRIMQLGFNPLSFTVERLPTDSLVAEIIVDLQDNHSRARRKFYLVQEGGRWQIDRIDVIPVS